MLDAFKKYISFPRNYGHSAPYGIKPPKGDDGFTLIEFSLVVIMAALAIATSLNLFDQHRKQQQLEENVKATARLNSAIQSYFQTNGHYPCPAPLTSAIGDADFGESTDCSDPSAGDYIRTSRDIDIDHDGTDETVWIRIGTLPFRTLSLNQPDTGRIIRMSQSDSFDQYARRYTYAVVERQGTLDYGEGVGAIRIEDEHGQLVADQEDFILVSHGPDGVGAYTTQGALEAPCDALTNGIDRENCDNDYLFVQSPIYLTGGPDHFDDTLTFMTWVPFYLWQQSDVDPMDIHNKNTGNVGVGTKSPAAKLHIFNGNMRSYYWDSSTPEHGTVASENMCNEDKTRCFAPGLMGTGTLATCNSDEINHGIAYSSAKCTDADYASDFTRACGSDHFISGYVYDVSTKTLTVTCKDPRAGR